MVRNHKQGGWGAEERAGGMPFHPGIDFIMTLEVKSNGYKVPWKSFLQLFIILHFHPKPQLT